MVYFHYNPLIILLTASVTRVMLQCELMIATRFDYRLRCSFYVESNTINYLCVIVVEFNAVHMEYEYSIKHFNKRINALSSPQFASDAASAADVW